MPLSTISIKARIARSSVRKGLVWMRERCLTENDFLVGSYPRSGSTWFRFMLHDCLSGNDAHFASVNRSIPDIGRGVGEPWLKGGGRIYKTHELYRSIYRRGIYVVRDVRDVVISEHAYALTIGQKWLNLDAFVEQFVGGRVNNYGSWQDHVESWLGSAAMKDRRMIVIKYEDMKDKPEEIMTKICSFLSIRVGPRDIARSVKLNTFREMRRKEDCTGADVLRKERIDGRFVRCGQSGGWRTGLSTANITSLMKCTHGAMERLGYEW